MTSISGQVLVLIGSDGKRATVSRAIATEASLVLRELLDGRVAVRSELNTNENLSFPSTLELITTSPTTLLTKVVATNNTAAAAVPEGVTPMMMMMTTTNMKKATQSNNKLMTEEYINNKCLELPQEIIDISCNNNNKNEKASIYDNSKLNSTLPPNEMYKLPDLMDFSAGSVMETNNNKTGEYNTQVKQLNHSTFPQTTLMNTSSSLSNLPQSVDHTQLPSHSQVTIGETNLLDYLMNNKSPTTTINNNNNNNNKSKEVYTESSIENNEVLNNNLFDAIDSALDASSGNRKNNINDNYANIDNGELISEPNSPFSSSEPFAMAINNNIVEGSMYHRKQFQEVIELPFPYFTGDILERVCQHMSYRFRVSSFGTENGMCHVYPVKMREIPKPMTLPLTEYLDLQDRRFISDWNETITVLMVKAATLLNYNELLQLASAKLASYLCEKNVDGIRILLGAASDFSQTEEAELKKEQVMEIQK